jgi:hypothetical protein
MSSSTVNKTTYKVRTDHVFWECEGCGAINSMEHHICIDCSVALNIAKTPIGHNVGLDNQGRELWHYNLTTNGNH